MSTFFKNFRETDYSFINDSSFTKKKVINILTSFLLRQVSNNKSTTFQKYSLKDGDTYEQLSIDLYDTPYFYWIFLILNNVVNPFTEWCYTFEIVEKFTEKKYAAGRRLKKTDGTWMTIPLTTGLNGIHHFYNTQTDSICDEVDDEYYRTLYQSDPSSIGAHITPVSNLSYEQAQDLERRDINILLKSHTAKFEDNFNKMLLGKPV